MEVIYLSLFWHIAILWLEGEKKGKTSNGTFSWKDFFITFLKPQCQCPSSSVLLLLFFWWGSGGIEPKPSHILGRGSRQVLVYTPDPKPSASTLGIWSICVQPLLWCHCLLSWKNPHMQRHGASVWPVTLDEALRNIFCFVSVRISQKGPCFLLSVTTVALSLLVVTHMSISIPALWQQKALLSHCTSSLWPCSSAGRRNGYHQNSLYLPYLFIFHS